MFFYSMENAEKESALGLPRYASTKSDKIIRFGREKRGIPEGAAIKLLPVKDISPNPSQPRRFFEAEAIASLADSIRQYGIIQPLTVRHLIHGDKYELIAGERRLRAASLLGMESVPCVILETDETESAALAIIENLQRENLNMFEQAAAISSLIRMYDLTQEDIARKLSVSQSFVANKLRLLRYLPEEKTLILSSALTERHARALLRLSGEDRLLALRHVIENHLNVAETEEYVESVLHPSAEKAQKPVEMPKIRQKWVVRDVRLFVNSIDHAVDVMRQAGIDAVTTRSETEEEMEIRIRIPKVNHVSRETMPVGGTAKSECFT
jgi:ParB family chromosome partitioning protein